VELNPWLDQTRLLVCVGSGGVGKTTTAAAIGLWAATRGRRVMVLTIDPAKRLANSLGLSQFGNAETRIDLTGTLAEGSSGELWAMMLDAKSTWDSVIARVAPNDEVRDRILANHVFRVMADTFAGSQEYMATEKLYDLVRSERYDLIVLDTPPVKNALDFLESPGRMVNFLDEKVLSWFLQPYDRKSVFGTLMGGASAVFFRLLGTILGSDFLDDMTSLMQDFKELYAGFRERHDAVMALFRKPGTAFLTVCAPTDPSVEVAEFFQEELARRQLPRAGVVVNQVHRCNVPGHDARTVLGDDLAAVSADPKVAAALLARLGMAHKRLAGLVEAEQALVRRVDKAARGGGFRQEVPRMDDDVHDLHALLQVGESLFERAAMKL
jgi:anion-transporting  ArsA/GET3 family ATPase